MARKRTKKKKTTKGGGNIGRLAWSLAVVAVIVFALYRYFTLPRGEVFLLDAGFNGKYVKVQQHLTGRILKAAKDNGVSEDRIREGSERNTRTGMSVIVYRVEVPASTSLLQLNDAIDRAVSPVGGRIRRCDEKKEGRALEMEIGTRSVVTHKCFFRLGREAALPARPRVEGPEISIVVDDFGYFNNRLVSDFLALDVPVTVSVIPGLKHSTRICEMAREAGKEILCHLPMEPERGADDVGEIPLVRVDMKGGEIERIVEKALKTTPYVVGMNNHMGSRATADREVMDAVLGVCREKGLFFFDSLTSPRSVVREAARAAGVASARNDLFLDNNKKDTRENMKKLLSMAERRGKVIAIMHVRKESLKDLKWLAEEARSRGVRFTSLKEMIEGQALAVNQGGSP